MHPGEPANANQVAVCSNANQECGNGCFTNHFQLNSNSQFWKGEEKGDIYPLYL